MNKLVTENLEDIFKPIDKEKLLKSYLNKFFIQDKIDFINRNVVKIKDIEFDSDFEEIYFIADKIDPKGTYQVHILGDVFLEDYREIAPENYINRMENIINYTKAKLKDFKRNI